MRYNSHFANHFGSCRLLKTGRDPHRERDVKIYALPGEFDVVGITDGTDSWVAPVATGFLEDVRKMLQRIQSGTDLPATTTTTRRQVTPHKPVTQQSQIHETAKVPRRVLSSRI